MVTLIQRWYQVLLNLAYLFRLRTPFNNVQRWLKERKEQKSPIPMFNTPDALWEYIRHKFQYRKDSTRIGGKVFPLDWVSHPRVFQTRLDSKKQRDGDCDDYHYYVFTHLRAMLGVEKTYLLSVGYKGGGHTCCVYKYKGTWFIFNYAITATINPNHAPKIIAEWGGDKESSDVYWYVWEDELGHAEAIGPKASIST